MHSNALKALQDRLTHLGEAVLHLKPNGGTEWLWGYFRNPKSKDLVRGLAIEMQDAVPVFRMLAADALDVEKHIAMNFQSRGQGSRLVIHGQEYKVRDKVLSERGEAILELASDCCPSPFPTSPPLCRAAMERLNHGCNESSDVVETHANPSRPDRCPV